MSKNGAELRPVYLIHSEHGLLLREALARLVKKTSGDGQRDLNVSFNAADDDFDEIAGALGTLSFLGEKRIIVLKDFLAMKKEARDRLLDYIANPNQQSVLVLSTVLDSADQRRQLKSNPVFQACSRSEGALVHEYKLSQGLTFWIRDMFKERGLNISDGAVTSLTAWVGGNLDRLSNEIDKIADAAGEDTKEIQIDLVKQTVVATNEAEVFDLIDSVVDRDPESALVLVSAQTVKDSEYGRIFGLLERQFQLLLDTKTKGSGLKGKKLAQALGVSSGHAYHLDRQGKLFGLPQLKRALGLLAHTDYRRKSSQISQRNLLEDLVVELCRI